MVANKLPKNHQKTANYSLTALFLGLGFQRSAPTADGPFLDPVCGSRSCGAESEDPKADIWGQNWVLTKSRLFIKAA